MKVTRPIRTSHTSKIFTIPMDMVRFLDIGSGFIELEDHEDSSGRYVIMRKKQIEEVRDIDIGHQVEPGDKEDEQSEDSQTA